MKKTIFLTLIATCILSACNDDKVVNPAANDRVPLQITATTLADTRLNGDTWQDGDQIGVFLMDDNRQVVGDAANVCYEVNADGTCQAAEGNMIFLDKGQTYNVVAYYPYTADLTESNGEYWMPVSDWNRPEEQGSLDVMRATASGVSTSNASIELAMERQCSRIELNFTFSDDWGDNPSDNLNVTLSGLNFPMEYAIRDKGWNIKSFTEGEEITLAITPDPDNDKRATASAIISGASGQTEHHVLTITLADDDVRTITIPSTLDFEEGQSYTWNVSLTPGAPIDDIVQEIEELDASQAITVIGYISAEGIARIAEAMKTLYNSHPEIKVTLDLSGTTGLTELQRDAFLNCKNMVGILLPEGLKSIGMYAFMETAITEVVVPEGVTELYSAFWLCRNLKKVTLPSSVTGIDGECFYSCPLETVSFTGNASLTMGNDGAIYSADGTKLFVYCPRNTESEFTLPATVTEIGNYAFCSANITAFNFESTESLTTIGTYTFDGCYKLTSFEMPNSVTSVDRHAFNSTSSLTHVTLSKSLTSIPDGCFCGSGLTEVVIPNGVTEINYAAFYYCSSLKTVTLPASLERIVGTAGYTNVFTGSPISIVFYYGSQEDRLAMTIEDGTIVGDNVTWYYNYDPETMGANNGHVYIDLGLPSGLKWATMNIGATKAEGYGGYFMWGETDGDKTTFNWQNYSMYSSATGDMTKYKSTSTLTLDAEDDAATANWGAPWRMPTYDEFEELISKCTWTGTTDYNGTGIAGNIVTGPNGNSIFLPANGMYDEEGLVNVGNSGFYWSATLNSSSTSNARYLGHWLNTGGQTNDRFRYSGLAVRAVLSE